MKPNTLENISNFFVAGVNYKKTNTSLRGRFAVSPDQYSNILTIAPSLGINNFFILSTCNRSEIFGFAPVAQDLVNLLCSETNGTNEIFEELGYVKDGINAIEHLFNVGAGLDSQILGDYEIIGQLKQAVNFSKKHLCVSPLLERMVNFVIQASKSVKNNTILSSGTVSVSFAAVQYIKENVSNIPDQKILLIGVGKIGRSTCKNIVDYLGTTNITLINRSEEKATELATELGLDYSSMDRLPEEINAADIILVATNADEPSILTKHFTNGKRKLIIDLSIPCNVDPAVKLLKDITLINVDELSQLNDETLKKREQAIPQAKNIITTHITEFIKWYEMRAHSPALRSVKKKLKQIHSFQLFGINTKVINEAMYISEEKIQQVINGMAFKMKNQNQHGCYYIEAINEFIK